MKRQTFSNHSGGLAWCDARQRIVDPTHAAG